MFSCNNFIILTLIFWSLIHFELIFVQWYEVGVQLYSFACGYTVVPAPFVEKTIFIPLSGGDTLFKISCPCMFGFIIALSVVFHLTVCLSSMPVEYGVGLVQLSNMIRNLEVSPQTLLLVFKSDLAIWGPLKVFMSFRISSSIYAKEKKLLKF